MTSVEGFEDAIRKFVCHVICITYQVSGDDIQNDNESVQSSITYISSIFWQTIEESVLSELLGLVQENAVGTWIEMYGWKVVLASETPFS